VDVVLSRRCRAALAIGLDGDRHVTGRMSPRVNRGDSRHDCAVSVRQVDTVSQRQQLRSHRLGEHRRCGLKRRLGSPVVPLGTLHDNPRVRKCRNPVGVDVAANVTGMGVGDYYGVDVGPIPSGLDEALGEVPDAWVLRRW
jgi:hypothetical protein